MKISIDLIVHMCKLFSSSLVGELKANLILAFVDVPAFMSFAFADGVSLAKRIPVLTARKK